MRKISNVSVCVVGGAGFLGSHLVEHLVEERNCKVLVLDNLVIGRREFVHKDATFEHVDITSSEDYLGTLFVERNVKYVFNYAAFPYVPVSFSRPIHVANVNFFGAMKVINAAQEAGCKGILQVSSAEVYGGPIGVESDGGHAPLGDKRIIDENAVVIPHSTYGASKAAIDFYCQCAWKERETPVIALRQFNCIGERETHPYVVPEIISQLYPQGLGKAVDGTRYNSPAERSEMVGVVKLGNDSFRDFMYAGDAVKIAVELLERGQFGEVYNLGSEGGIKIYDLAKLIGKLMGFSDVTVEVDESRKRPWDIWHLQSDNAKIWDAIDPTEDAPRAYRNLIPLEEALKRTITWFESNGRRWPWEK